MKKSSAKQRFADRGGASVKSEIFLGKIEADSFAPTPSRRRKNKRQAFRLPCYMSPCDDAMAETVGFEPTVPKKVQLISSQSRYDHFDTSPDFMFK